MALNDITVERTRGTAPLGPAHAPFIPRRDRRELSLENFSKIFALTLVLSRAPFSTPPPPRGSKGARTTSPPHTFFPPPLPVGRASLALVGGKSYRLLLSSISLVGAPLAPHPTLCLLIDSWGRRQSPVPFVGSKQCSCSPEYPNPPIKPKAACNPPPPLYHQRIHAKIMGANTVRTVGFSTCSTL